MTTSSIGDFWCFYEKQEALHENISQKLAKQSQISFKHKFRSKLLTPKQNHPLRLSKINHLYRLSCRSATDLLLGNCNKTKVTVLRHGLTEKRSQCKEERTAKNNKNIPQRFIILFLVSKDSLAFSYYLPSLPSIHKYYDSIFIFKGQ